MSKTQSGLVLMGVGIVVNVVNRGVLAATSNVHDVSLAGLLLLLQFASVVIVLFGLYRLVCGLVTHT